MFFRLLVLSLIVISNQLFSETLAYSFESSTNKGSSRFEISPVSDGFFILSSGDNGQGSENQVHADFSLKSWKFHSEKNDTVLSAFREGNTIQVSGTFKGKSYQKSNKIDDNPWYELWGLGIQQRIMNEKSDFYFWSINPNDPNMVSKFRVTREKNENILVAGKTVPAIRTKIAIAGMELFWHADYWFRASDGREIMEKMQMGPGGPEFKVTLTEEK